MERPDYLELARECGIDVQAVDADALARFARAVAGNVIPMGSAAVVADAQRYRRLKDRTRAREGYPMVVIEKQTPTGVYITPADPEKLDQMVDEAPGKTG